MIWIFLPAYNEASALPLLLPKLHDAVSSRGLPYRLVVVDDGSRDDTPAILERFRDRLPLDVITHPINRGLGETERDGFEYVAARAAADDVIVRVEGDNTHEPEYLFRLLAKLEEGYDVVNTSRFQPGGGQLGVDGFRAFISRGANLFMRAMFGIPGVRDYSCGYRAYRAAVIRDAIRIFGNHFIQLRGLGFTSTLEVIVKLNLLRCRFAEVPFVLRYDQKEAGSSKMVSSLTTLGYLIMAVLYHWPFGGWRRTCRDLGRTYPVDPERAIEEFTRRRLAMKTAARIGF